ncbi:P-loop containing nucleoside triphosphate hydrolase protein [Russula dissimulans]|nr:P-loop containing nucleoside triphosphate hydrolase protein [Russula dissimulans]
MTIAYLEVSSTTTQVENQAILGGNATQFAHNQLRLMNTLHDIGLDVDIDLPIIAVIGSQSSGKSSLIYSTTGVPLPKAPGEACTRCPIECRLTRREEPWSCAIFLRRRSPSGGLSKEPFGEVITDSSLLTNIILRAQLAILNPRTPALTFLDVNTDLDTATDLSFTSDIVCLEITGPGYSDISFIDLPGLIRNVGTTGNRENIRLIEELATEYISKPNCIILMTITCETDFANQGAYELARSFDPFGHRTVGVLTKPDRIPDAAHDRWVQYIDGEAEPLRHGWFCVKQHDSQSPGPLPSLVQVREYEEQYFNKTSAWQSLPRQSRDRLGTRNLVRHLEDILSQLIHSTLPDIKFKIRELQDSATHRLERLGKPPSEDSVGEINTLVDQLVRDIEGGIEQRSLEGGLLRKIEAEAVIFISELRATCPEFRAWNQDTEEPPSVTPLPELLFKDGGPPVNGGNREVIYLDEVLNKKTRYETTMRYLVPLLTPS